MNFFHIVTPTLINDSFFCSSLFYFSNTNTSVRSFIFSLLTTVLYIYKGPLSEFQPAAPHNLNPPLHVGLSLYLLTFICDLRYKILLIYTCAIHQEIINSPDISKVYACVFRPVKSPMRTLHKHISLKKFISLR